MKLFLSFVMIVWLISGLAGAWMLEGSHMHWKTVALGPISLVRGYNSAPEFSVGPF